MASKMPGARKVIKMADLFPVSEDESMTVMARSMVGVRQALHWSGR